MAYCIKCGAQVNDGVSYCPQCGGEIPKSQEQNKQYEYYQQADAGQRYEQTEVNQGYYQNTYQSEGEFFNAEDVRQNKAMGVLSYIGILVLIPLFARDKQSEYAAFHTNQGLVLFITNLIADALTGGGVFGWASWLFYDYGILHMVSWVLDIVLFVFLIMGIVNACKGIRKELPLIGKIKIIR